MAVAPSIGKRFFHLRTAVTVALALAFILFLLFRLDVDLAATGRNIRNSNPWLYLLAFVTYYATFPLRGWRWHLLLRNAGVGQPPPSSWRLTPIIILNLFANCVLYARLGDVYRAYLLREDTGSGFSRTVGTVAAERVLDLVVVVGLLLLAGVGLWQQQWLPLLWVALGFLTLLTLGLGILRRWGPSIAHRLPARLGAIFLSFQQGVLGSFRSLPLIAVLSVSIWLLETGRFFLISYALGIYPSPWLLLLAAQAIALLVALPFTPGGLGVVEPGVAGILMLGLSREQSWSISLMDRTVSYLSLIVIGLMVLLGREVAKGWQRTKADKP